MEIKPKFKVGEKVYYVNREYKVGCGNIAAISIAPDNTISYRLLHRRGYYDDSSLFHDYKEAIEEAEEQEGCWFNDDIYGDL